MIVQDNFFSTSELRSILTDVTDFFRPGVQQYRGWTNLAWPMYLQTNSSLIFIVPYPDINDIVLAHLRQIDNSRFQDVRVDCQLCVWHRGSSIPWHNDRGHGFAGTVYLSENWRVDDGGILFFRDDQARLNVVDPIQNRAVINTDFEVHHVSQITMTAAHPRYTVQFWGQDAKDPLMQPPEPLQRKMRYE